MATRDAGTTWAAQTSGTRAPLFSVAIAADGQRGWAVGVNGTIVATRDAGATWAAQTSGTREWLFSVAIAADGQRGWAVGENGTIHATNDGGETWGVVRPWRDAPAPWFFVATGLIAIGFVRFRRNDPPPPETSIAGVPVSDAPLKAGDFAALDTRGLAVGVARFLANQGTEPPLTLGITGDWGSGKSSLMNLIGAELEHYGFCTVRFNAWHHQTEEFFLAALMEAIREQAVPALYTAFGWAFRGRLLLQRARNRALAVVLTVAALAFVVAHVTHANAPTDYLFKWLPFLTDSSGVGEQIKNAAPWLAGLLALIPLWRGTSVFGVSMSQVVSTLSGRLHVDRLKADPGIRQRFSEIFGELTAALGRRHRLAIFVDDLDRCQQQNTLSVLEVVNFLVSSGDCFVVLGMARKQVEGALGLAFKEVADELADREATPSGANRQREIRTRFARQYLDKLINIEVPILSASAEAYRDVLLPPPIPPVSFRRRAAQTTLWLARNYGLIPLALGVAVLAVLAGRHVPEREFVESTPPDAVVAGLTERLLSENDHDHSAELATLVRLYPAYAEQLLARLGNAEAQRLQTALSAEEDGRLRKLLSSDATPTELSSGVTPAPAARRVAPSPPAVRNSGAGIEPGYKETTSGWVFSWLVSAPVMYIALALWAMLYALSGPLPLERDSPVFEEALKRWYPIVAARTPSPRGVKRFLNRVRYFAMRQKSYEPRSTVLERLAQRVLGSASAPPVRGPAELIPEDCLVALSAVHHAFPQWLDDPNFWSETLGTYLPSEASKLPDTDGAKRAAAVLGTWYHSVGYEPLAPFRERFVDLTKGITVR